MRRQLSGVVAALLCIFVLWAGGKDKVLADAPGPFSGGVEFMKKDGDSYVMQVTAENMGKDFSGTVQLIFAPSRDSACAYNTEITLPEKGRKQFTVTVPEQAAETMRGVCALNFLDEEGELLQSLKLQNVFGNTMSGFSVGILSDDYSSLTFMDAGGVDYSIRGNYFPLNLVELDKDNLKEYLDGLYFLVIDQFNMSVLEKEDIRALQDWVLDGGWLLIGTGEYAEQTLSGFDQDFLEVNVLGVTEAGEENDASLNADYGQYNNYVGNGVDFKSMRIAKLDCGSKYGAFYESSLNPAFCGSLGDGSAIIFTFSLGEEELRKLDSYAIQEMYDELITNSDSYQSFNGYSDMDYVGRRTLSIIDNNNTDIDFTWLKLLIGFYVILIGPALYIILRKCRKREWYWVCVPATGLLFILCVFIFGREARVVDAKVYSVTVQQADGTRAETYFLAYHSGLKPWNMLLDDSYESAGPAWGNNSYYYGSGNSNLDDYHYMVDYGSDGMRVGIKPAENFESGFLYGGKRTEKKGTISSEGISGGSGSDFSGRITNGTSCDMAYMAVWDGTYVMVFRDVKAGETIDLHQAALDGRCVYQDSATYYDNMMYDMLYYYGYHPKLEYEVDDMAALLIGMGIAEEARTGRRSQVIVTGVVKDYEKAVASKCNEISYGCLYSYIEMEAGRNASD